MVDIGIPRDQKIAMPPLSRPVSTPKIKTNGTFALSSHPAGDFASPRVLAGHLRDGFASPTSQGSTYTWT